MSRVLVSFKLSLQILYFAHGYSEKFNTTIFKYDCRSGSLSGIVDLSLNLTDKYIVQVRQDLYGFKHNATPSQLFRYSNLEGGKIKTEVMQRPLTDGRAAPTLCNYMHGWIFVMGGKPDLKILEALDTVELYDIRQDAWSQAPCLT